MQKRPYRQPTPAHGAGRGPQQTTPIPSAHAIAVNVDEKIDKITLSLAGSTKRAKRDYIITGTLPDISPFDPKEFRQFIVNLLMKRGNLHKSEAEEYTTDQYMPTFIRSVTHDSVNPYDAADNYEMLEHLGDTIVNTCATWYLKGRFPDIIKMGNNGVKIISKQKSLITSKQYLAIYSSVLGFDKYIRFRPLEFEFTQSDQGIQTTGTKRITLDRSMKEDVFEAFFAAVQDVIDAKEGMVGVGYSVVFKILSSLFDEQTIPYSLHDLVDAKTQLKEIFDLRKPRRNKDNPSIIDVPGDEVAYIQDPRNKTVSLYLNLAKDNPKPLELVFTMSSEVMKDGEFDYQTSKKIIEQKLAKDALNYLQKHFGKDYVWVPKDERS